MTEDFVDGAPLRSPRWRRRAALAVALVAGAATACAEADQQADELPPVEDTAPSEDERILNDPGTMSDGSPISPHTTETVATSLDMVSEGAIGGMTMDADGNVYNTNFGSTIWKTAPDGATTVLSDDFVQASGNFALDDGSLLQADYEENVIYRVAPDGARSVFAEGGLDGPVGIVQRQQGDFIVANYGGHYLARVSADGSEAEIALRYEKMTRPNGVTIDPDGNIYVADLESGVVFKWTPAGEVIELAELPGKGNAHNVYAGGALYVNKIWDHVVYRVDLETGVYGIVAGDGRPGFDDGPTGTATIEEPNGIATNAAKDVVYFNTHRGKMFEAPGRVIVRRLVLPAS